MLTDCIKEFLEEVRLPAGAGPAHPTIGHAHRAEGVVVVHVWALTGHSPLRKTASSSKKLLEVPLSRQRPGVGGQTGRTPSWLGDKHSPR